MAIFNAMREQQKIEKQGMHSEEATARLQIAKDHAQELEDIFAKMYYDGVKENGYFITGQRESIKTLIAAVKQNLGNFQIKNIDDRSGSVILSEVEHSVVMSPQDAEIYKPFFPRAKPFKITLSFTGGDVVLTSTPEFVKADPKTGKIHYCMQLSPINFTSPINSNKFTGLSQESLK